MKRILISLLLYYISNFTFASEYKFKDLEILAKEGSWTEFLEHAFDVPPSERVQLWRSYYEQAVIESIKQFQLKKNYTQDNWQKINKWNELSFLKESSVFRTYQYLFAEKYFAQELSESIHLITEYIEFVKSSNKQGVALDFIMITLPKMIENGASFTADELRIQALPFMENQQKNSCTNHLEQYILIQYLSKISKEQISRDFSNKLSLNCWANFKSKILADIQTAPNKMLEKILILAKDKKNINQINLDIVYFTYLLNGPVPGSEFNYSWSRLKQWPLNYVYRKELFEKIKKFDPLPGNIFKSPDSLLKETLFNELNSNFPEYIHYYADTCLKFKQNPRAFINGRKAFECKEFFDLSIKFNTLPERLIKQYFVN